jgi:hypothetical protein
MDISGSNLPEFEKPGSKVVWRWYSLGDDMRG